MYYHNPLNPMGVSQQCFVVEGIYMLIITHGVNRHVVSTDVKLS